MFGRGFDRCFQAGTMKICLAASAGGHLTQLLRLIGACEAYDHFIVTTGTEVPDLSPISARTFCVGWANRNHPLLASMMFVRCLSLYLRERPDVLVSTGAAVGCILAILTKVFGGTVIWIDTISHTEYLTLSGRIVRHFADIFLVQWPELTVKYNNVQYVGSVI